MVTGFLIGLAITEQFDYNALSAETPRTPDRYTRTEWEERSCFRNFVCARCGLIFTILWFIFLFLMFFLYTNVDVEQNNDN